MGSSAQIEEAEMAHQPAAHDLVGRNGGIEAAGHQYKRLFRGPERITADAVVLAVDHEQPLVANFDTDFDFGLFQVDPGGTTLTAQLAADIFLDVYRTEWCLPARLQRTEKIFPASASP